MAVYKKNGTEATNVYNREGVAVNRAYDIHGNVVFPDILTSYEMFYPDDADGSYEVDQGWNTTLTADEFLALKYDGYVSNPPTGITVTKASLGKDSTNTYDIYEYTFTPQHPIRKILLISGEHAYETTASFGLAHLIHHIYADADNPTFAYIRKNVQIKVIPIMNPWAYNQAPKEYGVADGTNPERNFDYGFLWENFTSSHDGGQAGDRWNKKGDFPFQTAETRLHANWTMANQDADFTINCHTGEDSNNRDVWVDYMSGSRAWSAIVAGVSKNAEEFMSKFSQSSCRTEMTATDYPNETGYGMHGAWNMFCVRTCGLTNEQAPHNTIFGNGKSNSAGAINNYASVTATYLMEMLLDKYQWIYDSIHPSNDIPITAVSGSNVSLGASDYTANAVLTMTPSDTTQFTFDWVSSNPSVCEVWGCADQAVIVKRGTGTATITVTNRLNNSVHCTFTVTVTN